MTNHFPKSTEITRKDNMYKHFAIMREKHGAKNFDYVPLSYVLPHEQCMLQEAMEKSNRYYIVKPSSSA